jgi:hypothetical protein
MLTGLLTKAADHITGYQYRPGRPLAAASYCGQVDQSCLPGSRAPVASGSLDRLTRTPPRRA